LAIEFPVMSLGEVLMKPTTMLYRNLAAMEIEEAIRAYPMDAVVLLCGCDKTTAACLMGAASANVPAIVVTGGPMLNGHWRGVTLGSCTDCRRADAELRAGTLPRRDYDEIESSIARSYGHCMTMGTASTMACVVEALGMTLPGAAAIPAVDSRRSKVAEQAGQTAVELVSRDLRPRDILTPAAFANAIRVLHAVAGSTNAIIHLTAIAGRVGIELPLAEFERLGEETPWLADIKPSGQHLMEDFFYAGGLPALMAQMRELLDGTAVTVTGEPIADGYEQATIYDEDVIRPVSRPIATGGSLAVLRGSLCPAGAIIKRSAADPMLLSHRGSAVVFDGVEDMFARIDDPDLEVDAASVLVLRNSGPVGGPGMPEAGA
jgi:dihydroxyacid dehydratase/phosphogluconate dehydratase